MPASLPIARQLRPVVYTKTTWAGDWTEQPLMTAVTLQIAAAPAHSQATLRWRYGVTMQPEIGSRSADSVMTEVPKGDFLGNYVRIEFLNQVWWGVIQDVNDSRHGLIDGKIQSGVQSYTAFGLTWFLDNCKPILQTKVKYSGGEWIIDRTIPFNGGTDGQRRPNSVAWKNFDETAKCFTDRSQSAEPKAWKASDAITYVLANFAPRDKDDEALVPFGLADDAAAYLNYELPNTEYNGLTPWQVIVRTIDRRRGLLLTTTVIDDEIKLVVRSQNAAEITLPSGAVIPANPDTKTYEFDRAVNIKGVSVSTTLLTKYDQVICLGERAGSVFTVRPGSNFEADWTTLQKDAYNAGASLLTGYGTLTDDDKAAANEDRRAADDFERVFSWWRASNAWNGRSATDPVNPTAPFALPKIDSDGVADFGTIAPVQRAGLRIADYLPLRSGVDYLAAAITPDTDGTDDADADYLPPMLFVKAAAIRSSGGDAGWVHGERLNAAYGTDSTKRPYKHSVDLSVREDNLGLILKTQGAPQHYLASDLYVPTSSFEAIPSGEGISSSNWLATVYIQQDQFCRAQYPAQADLPELDLVRPLVLRFANAFMDYVVPGTVLACRAGELLKTAAGGFVRDDRQRLRDIARMAFAWYGTTRRILSLPFRGIVSGFEVGHLITTIGRGATLEEINTAITSVAYDFEGGTMQVQTSFGELDFTT